MRVTIYDMDGTLLCGTTFTPFLVSAAARLAPWRLALLPVWLALMVAHKLGLIDRTALKHRGMRLMLGRPREDDLEGAAQAFAAARLARLYPGAREAMARDREEGREIVIATAAYHLYACHIAKLLQVDHVIASAWSSRGSPQPNCYGAEKLARVQAWMAERGWERDQMHLRFVSDSKADAPLLDWADEAIVVNGDRGARRLAARRGWRIESYSGGR